MGPQSLTTRRRSRELSESLLKKVKLNPTKMSIDADEVKRICDIYDWHGKGVLDMYYFMDIFYAMGMNPTKKVYVKYGQTDDVEKKFLPFDEVVELAKKVVAEPEHTGNYHDFVELCKLYDKNENGTMMLAELETFLSLMVTRSPRKIALSFWNLWLILRMRMVSSPTLPSLTNCVESKLPHSKAMILSEDFIDLYFIKKQ